MIKACGGRVAKSREGPAAHCSYEATQGYLSSFTIAIFQNKPSTPSALWHPSFNCNVSAYICAKEAFAELSRSFRRAFADVFETGTQPWTPVSPAFQSLAQAPSEQPFSGPSFNFLSRPVTYWECWGVPVPCGLIPT